MNNFFESINDSEIKTIIKKRLFSNSPELLGRS